MREEVARLVAEGKTREQIYEYYVAKYGSQEPLASPIDKGFNRLAWLVPYLAGATGALGLAYAAAALVAPRPPAVGRAAGHRCPPQEMRRLNARLNDELRDLD